MIRLLVVVPCLVLAALRAGAAEGWGRWLLGFCIAARGCGNGGARLEVAVGLLRALWGLLSTHNETPLQF